MNKQHGYKKYMKKKSKTSISLIGIFLFSFFGMLLLFTFLIKSFSPSVDTAIGDYEQELDQEPQEQKVNVDNRLSIIQSEDQDVSFREMMKEQTSTSTNVQEKKEEEKTVSNNTLKHDEEPIYKVFIGNYTTIEHARVAKEIIQESGTGINPIVKCIGSNDYTLQVGIFKNKQSAETLMETIQQNHLPARIVTDY